MHYADIRPELDRDKFGRISPRVVHMHQHFSRRPRYPQMGREYLERLIIALLFGTVITGGLVAAFWMGWMVAEIARHFMRG